MFQRMFNRLIARTQAHRSLLSLYTGEMERCSRIAKNLYKAKIEAVQLESKICKLKRKLHVEQKSNDTYSEALDMAIAEKYRAIGASVALADQVAHLRKRIDSTEYLRKYVAEYGSKIEEVAGSPGWAVKMLAKSFADTMGNAPNFVSTVVSHPDYGDFEYMVRRRDGKTVGEWGHEAIGHLKAVTEALGNVEFSLLQDGVLDKFTAARDYLDSTEKLTHDFATRENEVKAEFKSA